MNNRKPTELPHPRIMMFGPHLNATSGISNVVNNWLEVGLDKKVNLRYVSTLKHYVPGRHVQKILEATSAYIQLLKVDQSSFDVAHIHFSTGMSFYRKLIVFKIAKLKGLPVVIHLHGSNFEEFYTASGRLRKRLIEDFFNQSDLVFVLSESWQEFCKQFCPKEKIIILYNGASTSKFSGKATNGVTLNVTCMGRLGKRKGTYDLLEAFERLSSEHEKVKLVLGGDGDIDRVKQIAKEKKLEDRIDVLGWVSGNRKIEVFQQANIYVLPSYNEGLPGSVLEAMAVGTPIISTKVGGIPELVDENVNGYLITPGDVDALYSKLKLLIENSQLRQKMGEESRRIIKEKFEIKFIVDKLINHYNIVSLNGVNGRLKVSHFRS